MKNIEEEVKKRLSEYRFRHCVGVASTACQLAKQLGVDESKAYIAGMTHDIAKEMTDSELIEYCKKNNLEIDMVEMANPQLLHAKAAAVMVLELGIDDEEIKSAIYYHSVAREHMTMLEKIIYLSDMIEPNREYKEAAELREMAKTDFTGALLNAFRYSIIWNLEKGRLVHNNTLLAWNYELTKIKDKDGNVWKA